MTRLEGNKPINPRLLEMLPGEASNCIEPLPEGEVAIWQWVLAEVAPLHHHGTVVIHLSPAMP